MKDDARYHNLNTAEINNLIDNGWLPLRKPDGSLQGLAQAKHIHFMGLENGAVVFQFANSSLRNAGGDMEDVARAILQLLRATRQQMTGDDARYLRCRNDEDL